MFNIPSHIGIDIDDYLGKVNSKEKILKNVCKVYDICFDIGIDEITFYGINDFYDEIVYELMIRSPKLLVVGNTESAYFPSNLLQFIQNRTNGNGMKVNLLVNYNIRWDMDNKISSYHYNDDGREFISNIDLIVVWKGENELKKFLPLQTMKSNIYIEKEAFINFEPLHIYNAIRYKYYKNAKYEASKA